MAFATTTTATLAASGASGTLVLTDGQYGYPGFGGVASGISIVGLVSGVIPVFVGAPTGAQAGVYITLSADARLRFVLTRRPSGWQASPSDVGTVPPQKVVSGDQAMAFQGPAQIAKITAADQVSLTITDYASGSASLSVVQ